VARLFVNVIKVRRHTRGIGQGEGFCVSGAKRGRRKAALRPGLVTLGGEIGGWGCRMDALGEQDRNPVGHCAIIRRSPS